jgi:VCBS repeat-containing protein
MAFVINDRVLETSAVTGTGPATLLGASTGFQSFSAGIGANNDTYYCIVNPNVANEFEVGFGTLDATGLILTRTTVYRSSNSNNAVVFTAGTKTVFVTYPSSRSVNYANDGSLTLTGALTAPTIAGTPNFTGTPTFAANATFTGVAGRIAGDFSNATVNSRTSFQTTATNAVTDVQALPSGSGTAASWTALNAADPTNASLIEIATNGATDVQVVSGRNGSGAYLPMTFWNNGSEQYRLNVNGNVLIGTTNDGAGTSKLRVAGTIESTTGGFKFPDGSVQTAAAAQYAKTIKLGNSPIQSFNYSFADALATTASHISMVPNAKTTNTLIALGPITGGSAYTTGTYTNVPLTGGSGTGAVATQVVVSVGAITSVTLPHDAGAVVLGTIVGGSGYVDGTYLNVPLTGGAGVNAVATSITVSGGAVTAVVLPAAGAGAGYVATNVLTAANTFLGPPSGTGSGFTYTVTQVSSFGVNYAYGDTLSVSAANVGGTGSGFSAPVGLLSAGGDELEMDGIKVSAQCLTNGIITVYVNASPGYIAGGRTFAYTLG